MITIKNLIQRLQELPQDSFVYAYEGEVRGIIVVNSTDQGTNKNIAIINASEDSRIEDYDE